MCLCAHPYRSPFPWGYVGTGMARAETWTSRTFPNSFPTARSACGASRRELTWSHSNERCPQRRKPERAKDFWPCNGAAGDDGASTPSRPLPLLVLLLTAPVRSSDGCGFYQASTLAILTHHFWQKSSPDYPKQHPRFSWVFFYHFRQQGDILSAPGACGSRKQIRVVTEKC